MKHLLLALFTFFSFRAVLAQDFPYEFEVLTGETYTPLDINTAQSLNQNQIWDDPAYQLGIGFNWFFMDVSTFQLFFAPDGGYGAMLAVPTTNDSINLIIPYLADIIDAGYNDNVSISPILKVCSNCPSSNLTRYR